MKTNKTGFTLLGILFLFSVWEAASILIGAFIIPPPWVTITDTVSILANPSFRIEIARTLCRVFFGFSAAFVLGILTGLFAGLFRNAEYFLRPVVTFFQGIPPILWAIPLILVLGIGGLSPVIVIALICYPLIVLNIIEGVKSEPAGLREMLSVFAPGTKARIKENLLPHLRPFITAALKIGIILGVKASVVAEYFGANDGIGFQVQAAYSAFKVRTLFGWAFFLIVFILFTDRLLQQMDGFLIYLKRRYTIHRKKLYCAQKDIGKLKDIFIKHDKAESIAIRDLSFSYKADGGHDASVLHNVDITVPKGQIAVISGDSGVGKTTLLNLIAGFLTTETGTITVPKPIGIVFQDDRLLPWKTVIDNTVIPLYYSGFGKKESFCFARYLLKETGLEDNEFKYPDELSGGMKKRAGLARCFARIPNAILLDEPFTGLHSEARKLLWKKLYEMLSLRDVPVIVVTHYPGDVPAVRKCRFYALEGHPAVLKKL